MKFFSENAELAVGEKLRKHSSFSSGITRSQSVKNTAEFCGKLTKPEHLARPSANRMEDASFLSTSKTLKAAPKGTGRSVKENVQTTLSQRQSKDCNPYATLPRASSVISTAEGTTRRTSIHDLLSKDTRQPVSMDASPPVASASSEYRVHQQFSNVFHCTPYSAVTLSANDLGAIVATTDGSEYQSEMPRNVLTGETNFIDNTFCFSHTHSDEVGTSSNMATLPAVGSLRPFLSLNTDLVTNVSGLPERPVLKAREQILSSSEKERKLSSENRKADDGNLELTRNSDEFITHAPKNTSDSESLLPVSEDTQTVWYEYGCV